MNEGLNNNSHAEKEGMASDAVAMYNVQPQTMEHLRYQGVETLMKIDDIDSLRFLVPKIQKIYICTIQKGIASKNIVRLMNSLDAIGLYEDNWDDEGAPAIHPVIIEFANDVIRNVGDYLLEHWSVFPSCNGTLKLEIHQPNINAGINIGRDEFSYYIHSGKDEIYGKSPNTKKNMINVLTQVYYGE